MGEIGELVEIDEAAVVKGNITEDEEFIKKQYLYNTKILGNRVLFLNQMIVKT